MLKFSCADSQRAASLLSYGAKAVLISEKGTSYMCSAAYNGIDVNKRLASFSDPVEVFHDVERLKSVIELDSSFLNVFNVFNRGELILMPEGRGLGITLLGGSCFDYLFNVSEPLYCYPLREGLSELEIVKLEGPDFMLVEDPFVKGAEPSVISVFGKEWKLIKKGRVSLAELDMLI